MNEKLLMTPGPTNVPKRVLDSMSQSMMHHRTSEFSCMLSQMSERLKYVFQTSSDVLTFPAAGTGGLEAVIVNLFSPGDRVLLVSIGVFGDRFSKIAQVFGLDVDKLEVPWGMGADPQTIKESLKDSHKAVIVTHNETSTAAANDIKKIAEMLSGEDKLLIVDAVSSLGGLELRMDEWGIDAVVTASQKALMSPPGLAFISLSERAWEKSKESRLPKYYWDFEKARADLNKAKAQNPYTPAVSLIAATNEALAIIQEEGIENAWKRHELMANRIRSGIEKIGLGIFTHRDYLSNTVTAVDVGEKAETVKAMMENEHGIIISGGQGVLKGRIIRIGHMGCIDGEMADRTLKALEDCMNRA
ncbi:soluble hydrogenase, small subunit [Peptoclostridium acidaminophilum DSM 3953]|uniref:Soluble hydrogenase, small subunit n=1 Tax=Peptoclostridium acidaminophilum DSM 3953 TaxID=1286171 RepID=W8TJA8_PEPAC|nr:alanine--glyoxylate aminotransferase family protein [Peptoclostridium acidaminophilum]AHM56292.1 soluble hydrogenase, small subunit [Peptoclostridium acidaminophilum DSM 3953]